jgi:hypothetical protein
MRRGKKSFRLVQVCLLSGLLAAGCAPVNGHRGLPPPGTAARAPAADHCSSRLNRTRAGGTVGSVVGFIAASALGSPLLGIFYQVGGYAIGFASADPCRKETATLATVNPQTANGATGKIAEEDLK